MPPDVNCFTAFLPQHRRYLSSSDVSEDKEKRESSTRLEVYLVLCTVGEEFHNCQRSFPKALPNQNFLAKIITKMIIQQKFLWFETMTPG